MTGPVADALRGIGPPDAHDRLVRFARLLLERGTQFNLTGARDPAAVAAHVADSLTLLPYVAGPLVDVGSGGGFPAIPLAIVGGFSTTLIEATRKKAEFLREVAGTLELPIEVVAERAETAAHRGDLRERFACASARALAGASTALELTLPFVAIGGVAVLPRGELEEWERHEAGAAALVLGGEVSEEVRVERRRRLLIARKRSATSDRFPRRPGIPAKRPLCRVAALSELAGAACTRST